ncbi:hypothetical protein M885DRAFT_496733 [Pelagophyceae sp. CCMP2097]|nr:hypothetical protein M885DRAFT_496733 [Pelagophyceae sp. CCMP2097]
MAMRPLLLLLALRFCARGAETAGGVAAVGEAAVVAEADATAVAADGEQTAVLSAFAAILTQPTLKALYNCSCATAPRFYIFEQKHAIRAGLAHQFSNLEALIAEGLSLGRAVLLDAPRLSGRHVNGKPQMHEAWTSFISLERSTFHLKSRGKDVCKGLLSSCVAEVTRRQARLSARVGSALFQTAARSSL